MPRQAIQNNTEKERLWLVVEFHMFHSLITAVKKYKNKQRNL